MIIPCHRCGEEIDSPNETNADYVIASDTIVREPTEVFIALKHNQATLQKASDIIAQWRKDTAKIRELLPDERPTPEFIVSQFQDNEFDAAEVPSVFAAHEQFGEDLFKVTVEVREKDIQKTGIVCPDCYRPNDFVIWGVHKEKKLGNEMPRL